MKLDPVEYDKDLYYFEKRFELPYGHVSAVLKVAGKPTDTGELNLTPLPDGEKFEIRIDPQPKSLKQLREEHEIEEQEGQKREQEARLAQRRTHELKQKIRFEQEQQIAKQE